MEFIWRDDLVFKNESVDSVIDKFCYWNRITKTEFNSFAAKIVGEKHLSHQGLRRFLKKHLKFSTKYSQDLHDELLLPFSSFKNVKYYCPECIKYGFHSWIHQDSGVSMCIIHKIPLVICCKCNSPFNSNNINLYYCSCGRKPIKSLACEDIVVFKEILKKSIVSYKGWLRRLRKKMEGKKHFIDLQKQRARYCLWEPAGHNLNLAYFRHFGGDARVLSGIDNPLVVKKYCLNERTNINFQHCTNELDRKYKPILNDLTLNFLKKYEVEIKKIIKDFENSKVMSYINNHKKCAKSQDDLFYSKKFDHNPMLCEWGYIRSYWRSNWHFSLKESIVLKDNLIDWEHSIVKNIQHIIIFIDSIRIEGNERVQNNILLWIFEVLLKELMVDFVFNKYQEAREQIVTGRGFKGYFKKPMYVMHLWCLNVKANNLEFVICRRNDLLNQLLEAMEKTSPSHFGDILSFVNAQENALRVFKRRAETNNSKFLSKRK